MTVTPTHNRIAYTGTAGPTVFPYDFMVLDDEDLLVYLDGVLQTTGYTVSGVGEAEGGNVTFTTAPASGVEILFIRATDLTQQVDLLEGSRLPADPTEGMWDKLHLICQDLWERTVRAIKVPVTSANAETEIDLPDPADPDNQDKVLYINGSGEIEARAIESGDLIGTPIIATGDLIQGSDSGTPERLAIGTTGQVATVAAGKVAWEDLPDPPAPRPVLLLAVNANLPGTNPAVLTRVDATSETWYQLDFANAGTTIADFELPALGIGHIVIVWRTTPTSGNMKWFVEVRDKEAGDALGSGTVRASNTATSAASGVTNTLNESEVALNYTPGANKRAALLRIYRTATDGSDTLANTASLLYIEVEVVE